MEEFKDIIKDFYLVSKSEWVFCFNITTRYNVYILPVIDLATREIVAALITFMPITPEMAAKFLDSFLKQLIVCREKTDKNNFTSTSDDSSDDSESQDVNKILKNDRIILHSDGNDITFSSSIKNVCLRYNVELSLSCDKHGNQVSKSYNRTIWYWVEKLCIKGFEKTPFSELPPEYQEALIRVAIKYINRNSNTKAGKLIVNTSPTNRKIAYKMFPYPYSFAAKNNSKWSELINYTNSTAVSKFNNEVIQRQLKLENGIPVVISERPNAFIARKLEFLKENPSIEDKIADSKQDLLTSQQEGKILKAILNMETIEKVIVFLYNLLKDNKSKISFENQLLTNLSSAMIKLQALQNAAISSANTSQTEVIDESQEIDELIKSITNDLNKIWEIGEIQVEKRPEKDLELIKRKKKKSL